MGIKAEILVQENKKMGGFVARMVIKNGFFADGIGSFADSKTYATEKKCIKAATDFATKLGLDFKVVGVVAETEKGEPKANGNKKRK